MSYVDILIPLVIGILMLAFPNVFISKKAPKIESRTKMFRALGAVLIGVAAVYLGIKQFSPANAWYVLDADRCTPISDFEAGITTPDDFVKKYGCQVEESSDKPDYSFVRVFCETRQGEGGRLIFLKGTKACDYAVGPLPEDDHKPEDQKPEEAH